MTALAADFTAIGTLWTRDLLRFWRDKARVVSTLAVPLFFLVMLGIGLRGSFSGPRGVSYTQFIFPGMLGMKLLFASIFSGISILWDKEFGFLKEVMVAPVSRTSIVLGRVAGGGTFSLAQALLLLLLVPWLAPEIGAIQVVEAILVMALLASAFTAAGILLALTVKSTEAFHLTGNFVTMPIFLLSGALFPVDRLPPWLSSLVYANPLTYGVDALRRILLGVGADALSLGLDVAVLLGFLAVSVAGAVAVFRRKD